MINISKSVEDYKELTITIRGIRDINSLVELMYDNPKYDITNDLRENRGIIDVNYKNICATIKQEEGYLSVLPDIEVWSDEKTLDFITVNVATYSQYKVDFNNKGELCIKLISPYDDQDYYYVVDNKVYRKGIYIETIIDNEPTLDGIDVMIMRLIELNRPLIPKMCYN